MPPQSVVSAWIIAVDDMETVGEAELARAEVEAFFGSASAKHKSMPKWLTDAKFGATVFFAHCQTRTNKSTFFKISATLSQIRRFIECAAYARIVVAEAELPIISKKRTGRTLRCGSKEVFAYIVHQRVYEETSCLKVAESDPKFVDQIIQSAWDRALGKDNFAGWSPRSRKKNEYLAHSFHKYKAKFFPRLARALINVCTQGQQVAVLDPMAGSGTTCFESALMGLPVLGSDIDPLSVLIAESKLALFSDLTDELPLGPLFDDSLRQKCVPGSRTRGMLLGASEIPDFIRRKMDSSTAAQIEAEISDIISQIPARTKDEKLLLSWIALSHAISTKISLRWMGTGDNRFALEISPKTVAALYRKHFAHLMRQLLVFRRLKDAGLTQVPPSVQIKRADANQLPFSDNSAGAVVTSPPYLPAASGRETYLRSRAPALVALGLLSERQILTIEQGMLGSIVAVPTDDLRLPRSVTDLVEWMKPQRARGPKAFPTLRYFQSLKLILREIKRVLIPGAQCALVVSSQHQFYELVSRAVVRKFDMVGAIVELATSTEFGVGLEVVRQFDIELPKMDYVQRPGGKHSYSETTIIFRKPSK